MRGFAIVAASTLALMTTGCGSSAKVRTKVTVTVDTPQGERSGSSVWSWTLSGPTAALGSAYNGTFKGEAVAVDLPGGRTLFALIKDQEMLAERQFDRGGQSGDRVAEVRGISRQVGETRRLSCEPRPEGNFDYRYDCPLLVTFGDIRDPKSVVRVDPTDLAATFGPGTRLRAITVAITDEPVTTGIEKRLVWLTDYYDKMLDGSSINNSTKLANSLTQGSFSIRQKL